MRLDNSPYFYSETLVEIGPMKAQADVQAEKSSHYSQLNWVGMTRIQTLVSMITKDGGKISLPALLDVGVDLAENNRGIHMSRLYRLHQEYILNQTVSFKIFSDFAIKSLESHTELSKNFACKLKLNLPVHTVSLRSNLAGFRNYPIELIFEKNSQQENLWLQFEVQYSSTCPQSESLSMEILKSQTEAFDHLPATPHAQRSRAVLQLQLFKLDSKLIESLIDLVEQALGTPVQTTVKKEDEKRFAQLNAENLMFCEDAARKISMALSSLSEVKGFSVYCEHQESLHPHNASSLNLNQFSQPQLLSFG